MEYLNRFSVDEQTVIQDLINKLKLSHSNQLAFITYIYEIQKLETIKFNVLITQLKNRY